jgi:hypothetical protein
VSAKIPAVAMVRFTLSKVTFWGCKILGKSRNLGKAKVVSLGKKQQESIYYRASYDMGSWEEDMPMSGKKTAMNTQNLEPDRHKSKQVTILEPTSIKELPEGTPDFNLTKGQDYSVNFSPAKTLTLTGPPRDGKMLHSEWVSPAKSSIRPKKESILDFGLNAPTKVDSHRELVRTPH